MGFFDAIGCANTAIVDTFGEGSDGRTMTLTQDGRDPVEFDGVFNDKTVQTDVGGVQTTARSVTIRAAQEQFTYRPVRKDRITARGRTWHIGDVTDDGSGMLTIQLVLKGT